MLTAGMSELGKRIRELRDKQDISLREFARKLGDISPAHVSDIENGRRNPSEDLLHKMASVLCVPYEDLLRLDPRVPIDELKDAMRRDPKLGFALRKIAEKNISGDDILRFVEGKPRKRGSEGENR